MDTGNLEKDLLAIKTKADAFFESAFDTCKLDDDEPFGEASEYWEMLDDKQRELSHSLQKDLLKLISSIIPLIKSSLSNRSKVF